MRMNRASKRSFKVILVSVITIAITIPTHTIIFGQKSMAQLPPLIPKSTTAPAPTNVTKAAPTNVTTTNKVTQPSASNANIPTPNNSVTGRNVTTPKGTPQGNATTTANSMTTKTAYAGNITTSTKSTGNTTQPQSSSVTGGSGQNQTNNMMGANLTGSIPIGPTIAKAIASQVHTSLANVSTTAEKAVGANAHSAAVRIGIVDGFLVYMALVVDNNNNFHGVLVDPGSGKVLGSTQMSMSAMMQGSMRMMMNTTMSGYGMGMMQNGMIKGPGMISGHP